MTDQRGVDSRTSDDLAGKYLTFVLDGEQYGLEILKVREINGTMTITSVPKTPPHIKGVINLRGKVIPVIDLRLKFDLQGLDWTEETCIIVVDVAGLETGLIVDRVSEVQEIQAEDIEPPPSFGAQVETNFILGMSKSADRVTILLNIDTVLVGENLDQIVSETDKEAIA